MSAKHTPWKAGCGDSKWSVEHASSHAHGEAPIVDSKGEVVAIAVTARSDERDAIVLAVNSHDALVEALKTVIEAAERALGDHVAPHDCFATGPMTGNPIADLVACPGCVQMNEIAVARAALAAAGVSP